MSTRLRTQRLGLLKDSRYILKNIGFSLESGEIFGIAGRSGSGKSSLLKLLCRLEEPSEGEVLLDDRSVSKMEPTSLRNQVTLVFQTPCLMGPKVEDDIGLGLKILKKLPADPEERSTLAKQWLERVHLPPSLSAENPKKLSVGEAQRVALARAMAIHPKFLLLDEPTSALDSVSKEAIEDTLKEAAEQGMGIALVSHDTRQLQVLARRGLELAQGEIIRTW